MFAPVRSESRLATLSTGDSLANGAGSSLAEQAATRRLRATKPRVNAVFFMGTAFGSSLSTAGSLSLRSFSGLVSISRKRSRRRSEAANRRALRPIGDATLRHVRAFVTAVNPYGAVGAASGAYAWPSDTSGELPTRMFSSNLSRKSAPAACRSPTHRRGRVKNPRRMAYFWRRMAPRSRRKLLEVLGGRYFCPISSRGARRGVGTTCRRISPV